MVESAEHYRQGPTGDSVSGRDEHVGRGPRRNDIEACRTSFTEHGRWAAGPTGFETGYENETETANTADHGH